VYTINAKIGDITALIAKANDANVSLSRYDNLIDIKLTKNNRYININLKNFIFVFLQLFFLQFSLLYILSSNNRKRAFHQADSKTNL
jgi:hypothetical protein